MFWSTSMAAPAPALLPPAVLLPAHRLTACCTPRLHACVPQGFLPTVLEDVPDMAVKFAVYEMMRGVHNKLQVGAAMKAARSTAAGLGSVCAGRRAQTHGQVSQPRVWPSVCPPCPTLRRASPASR